jgi:diguanylate cyclase (GGDEF)-like protein
MWSGECESGIVAVPNVFKDLPPNAARRVVYWTALITALFVVASTLMSIGVLDVLGNGINLAGLVVAVVLPVVLGGPVMFYQALRHQQLKVANARLNVLASTDWLTNCLNRRAFTDRSSILLDLASGHGGTLLVIDADHFKQVNDQFGHDAGDAALQLLAATIRAAVRQGDLVGRLGGEEFGVFLVDSDYETAAVVAERVRARVAAVRFTADGAQHALSVSIGGATAGDRVRFTELFHVADQQLYGAKSSGRNRIELVRMSPSIEAPANINRAAAIDKTAAATL